MRLFKVTVFLIAALFVFAFLHYTMPQRDIVRVVNTFNERQTLQGWTTMFWGSAQVPGENGVEVRDVQFIQAFKADGEPMVYRNEDTGWGWPPYFKFDTTTLFTEAADVVSDAAAPQWVIIKHYGWRSEFLTTFPNAISIKPATGPDQKLIPYGNLLILFVVLVIVLLIRRAWVGFRRRAIDPLVEDVEERWDDAAYATKEKTRGLKRLFSKK